MTPQPTIFDKVHVKENNRESLDHLNDNRKKFETDCSKILSLLQSGVRLTVRDAMLQHNISSLPRRILDLKDAGYRDNIKDQWIKPEGKPKYKVWYWG